MEGGVRAVSQRIDMSSGGVRRVEAGEVLPELGRVQPNVALSALAFLVYVVGGILLFVAPALVWAAWVWLL